MTCLMCQKPNGKSYVPKIFCSPQCWRKYRKRQSAADIAANKEEKMYGKKRVKVNEIYL